MRTLTASQQRAIAAPGNVLVVAGAGTGKTRTIVERALRLMREGGSLSQMLMVTFTDAAAAEMRQRIREALLAQLKSQPGDPHLAEQVALLDTASISTLHSFCRQLVIDHACELGLDPQVTVFDESQTQPLIEETIEALFARHYRSDSPLAAQLRDLVRRQGRGSDERIRGLIVKVHRYTQTLHDPGAWFERERERFNQPEPDAWRQWLAEAFPLWREGWLPVLRDQPAENENAHQCARILERIGIPPASEAATGVSALLSQMASVIAQLHDVGQPENWAYGSKGKLRAPLEKFFDDVEFLHALTDRSGTVDPLQEDWDWARHEMLTLLELALQFGADFSRAKRELGGLDFADLEQFALQILIDPVTGEPTNVARGWQERFDHVFVDEYQDINEAQDAILRALSRPGERANRFLVGDVKQSIYRFRLANPGIFRSYEELWRADAKAGTRIFLTENFRSREAVLEFINELFATLMRRTIGGVDYDADAQLRFADPQERRELSVIAGAPLPRVELHILTKRDEVADAPDEEVNGAFDLTSVEREARLVALRLRELKDQGHLVWDKQMAQFRPVGWSDMAVLMRSPASKIEAYAKEFYRAGVPLLATRGGFYEAMEVMDLHSLLKLLDNPLQDVPLLAVLRSPLVGMSPDELAEVRSHNREPRFWTAMCVFHRAAKTRTAEVPKRPASRPPSTPSGQFLLKLEDEPPADGLQPTERTEGSGLQVSSVTASAWHKVDEFVGRFHIWRELVRLVSLSHCLETVLGETYYEALLLAGERGAARVANVRRFLNLARQYDPFQRQGLFRFLRFLATQEDTEQDREPAPQPTSDAVQLMSIHKSKGLEFPVVVVADLGKRFNLGALNEDILLCDKYGLCPRVIPPQSEQRYPSLPYWLARQRERRELLGEELRLLYVAMTRARDTLVLTGFAGKKEAAGPWESGLSGPIPDPPVLAAQSYLDWLRLWLPQVTQADDWREDARGESPLLRWQFWMESDPRLAVTGEATRALPKHAPEGELSEATAQELEARVAWRYPFAAATLEPAKTSVSELKRRQSEAEEEAWPLFPFRFAGSAFRVSDGLSAAERGTAHHIFQQFVALERTNSIADLREEAAKMERAGVLRALETAALDFEALGKFWDSTLGRRIRAEPEVVRRELQFTARFSPADLAMLHLPAYLALPPDDFIVVQGVVDLAVLRSAEIWILDFKTDEVTAQTLDEKASMYTPQVTLYALALKRIYQRPVSGRWLHFLNLGRTVAV